MLLMPTFTCFKGAGAENVQPLAAQMRLPVCQPVIIFEKRS
jgi:hypothetical protein